MSLCASFDELPINKKLFKFSRLNCDLFNCIDLDKVQCFNEQIQGSVLNVIRPMADKLDNSGGPPITSAYGPDLVLVIPFNSEVKVKTILVIGGDEGRAPASLKVYKNEENADISIIEDKAPIQKIDMNENLSGDLEYPLNVTKFVNVG